MNNALNIINLSSPKNVSKGIPAGSLSLAQAVAYACCQKIGVSSAATAAGKNSSDMVLRGAYEAQQQSITDGAIDKAKRDAAFVEFAKTVKSEMHSTALKQWIVENGHARYVGSQSTGTKDENGKAIKRQGPDVTAAKATKYFSQLVANIERLWQFTDIQSIGHDSDGVILETTNRFRVRAEAEAAKIAAPATPNAQLATAAAQLATSLRSILTDNADRIAVQLSDETSKAAQSVLHTLLTLVTRAQLIAQPDCRESATLAAEAIIVMGEASETLLESDNTDELPEESEAATAKTGTNA